MAKDKSVTLQEQYVVFQKQFGSSKDIEDVVLTQRRHFLEEELSREPLNYDLWFDYITLEEQGGSDATRLREIYSRAVKNVPPAPEKRFWKRYIYLWLNWAIFEEQAATNDNFNQADQVYEDALKLVPHADFSFSKLWI